MVKERRNSMTGCDKKSIKDAIGKIGSYLVNNAEAIAGDFDLMTGFDLNIKFRTDKDYLEFPEISFTNHHYIPLSVLDEEDE